MEYDEDDFLNLSGIQHFSFCRRQWALIHIEQCWQENLRTIEGEHLHDKAHDSYSSEKRGDIVVSRGMPVFSKTMGINGVCDIVELHKSPHGVTMFNREGKWLPVPVEYKHGSPKENDCDALQLCAQAMCLEEMLACEVKEGYLFYGEINRRIKLQLDAELRDKVKSLLLEMHDLYQKRHTPKGQISKSCKACSIAEFCMPKLCKNKSAANYIMDRIKEVQDCENS